MRGGSGWLGLGLVVLLCIWPARARAWILHEHETVVRDALASLEGTPAAKALERAWQHAIHGQRLGLCGSSGGSRFVEGAGHCIGLGTLAALAGDHSCGVSDLDSALRRPFVRRVLDVGRDTARRMKPAHERRDRSAVIDAWRDEHIRLQFADKEYLTRAAGNDAHFQLMREHPAELLPEYALRVLSRDAEPSAVSMWVLYHSIALVQADGARSRCEGLVGCDLESRRLLWRALLSEAFALHFLSDAFSAGHFVGTWGKKPMRMGTHDYYSTDGIEARQWNGDAYVAHGDAFLADADRERVAPAIARSLQQLARALSPRGSDPWDLETARAVAGSATDFDSCKAKRSGIAATLTERVSPLYLLVLEGVPIPATRQAPPPRIQNDVGAFLTLSVDVALRQDVAPATAPWAHIPFGVAAAPIGAGVSLTGITSSTTDGLVYLRLPVAVDGSVPGRSTRPRVGLGVELHAPFYALPFDSIPIGLGCAVLSAFDAANGCLRLLNDAAAGSAYWHFGRLRHTDGGAWQVALGREATFTLYLPSDESVGEGLDSLASRGARAADYWRLRAPLLAWTPVHEYSGELGTRQRLLFGGDVSRTDHGMAYGVYLAWVQDARLYFWRPD